MGNILKDGNSMVTAMVTFINSVLVRVCNPYVTMLPLLPYNFPKFFAEIQHVSEDGFTFVNHGEQKMEEKDFFPKITFSMATW